MMNRTLRTVVALFGLLLFASVVSGETEKFSSDLNGRTLRVTAPSLAKKAIEGRAASLTNDTLRLEDCRPSLDLQLVPISAVTKVQVLDGRKGHTLEGVLIGAGVGLAVWGAIELSEDSDDDQFLSGLDENLSKLFLVVFTGGGALTGGIVGTCIRTDRWRDVPVDKIRFSISPVAGRRVGLSMTIRF